jgi:hypothetical protein
MFRSGQALPGEIAQEAAGTAFALAVGKSWTDQF